jgi:hypothetical protein
MYKMLAAANKHRSLGGVVTNAYHLEQAFNGVKSAEISESYG